MQAIGWIRVSVWSNRRANCTWKVRNCTREISERYFSYSHLMGNQRADLLRLPGKVNLVCLDDCLLHLNKPFIASYLVGSLDW